MKLKSQIKFLDLAMKICIYKLFLIILISSFCCDKNKTPLTCQNELDQKCWPKNGTIRRSIELPIDTFSGYGLKLKPGYNDSTLHFDLASSGEDVMRFELDIYPEIGKAQLGLLDFYYAMNSPFKPPRLSKDEFPFGDVAFGEEKEGIFFVFFTRDNVRIIIDAPTNISKELAQKIDDIILNSPAWKAGNLKPYFFITNEFL